MYRLALALQLSEAIFCEQMIVQYLDVTLIVRSLTFFIVNPIIYGMTPVRTCGTDVGLSEPDQA